MYKNKYLIIFKIVITFRILRFINSKFIVLVYLVISFIKLIIIFNGFGLNPFLNKNNYEVNK